MQDFSGKLAVVTGAATGIGRELARQLANDGCHLALCDISVETLAATVSDCQARGPEGLRVTGHRCDVAVEASVLAFRDELRAQHESEHIDLLFNNAGVGGGGSFLRGDRAEWERTFDTCWFGVYFCTRAFMPMLVKSEQACLVNVSSVNGFWASLTAGVPHTAYSAAKFAVKGFTEALLTDLKVNAPHVKAFVVMPGHVGTDIGLNSRKLHGRPAPSEMDADELALLRKQIKSMGMPADQLADDQLRGYMQQRLEDFRDKAPTSAAQAAGIVLDAVRRGQWRILVGEDAKRLDAAVRAEPEQAYEPDFAAKNGPGRRG
jgi:NAD(P)-dependent dehydrogenase (short-subunit alcohol dehydrogenase family)